jgi:hypothetical protein
MNRVLRQVWWQTRVTADTIRELLLIYETVQTNIGSGIYVMFPFLFSHINFRFIQITLRVGGY